MSQYGNQLFYIHYYCSLLLADKEHRRYEIRHRDSRNDNDKINWIGDSEENAKNAMLSLIDALEEKILPWFDSIQSIEDFLIEDYMMHNRTYSKNITNFYDDWLFKVVGKNQKDFLEKGKKIKSLNEDRIAVYSDRILNAHKKNKISEDIMKLSFDEITEKIQLIKKEKKILLCQLFKDTKNIFVDEI